MPAMVCSFVVEAVGEYVQVMSAAYAGERTAQRRAAERMAERVRMDGSGEGVERGARERMRRTGRETITKVSLWETKRIDRKHHIKCLQPVDNTKSEKAVGRLARVRARSNCGVSSAVWRGGILSS